MSDEMLLDRIPENTQHNSSPETLRDMEEGLKRTEEIMGVKDE